MKYIDYPPPSESPMDAIPYSEAANQHLPPMVLIKPESSAFLRIPLDIRLMIYDLCFFPPDFDTQPLLTRAWKHPANHPLDFLLTCSQIYHEARDLAYAAQRRQLIRSHQTYYIGKSCKLFETWTDWTWDIESHYRWQPSVRSAKALAALRLPKLGLAIRDPTGGGSRKEPRTEELIKTHIDGLQKFCSSLVYHLRKENATKNLEIYLEGRDDTRLRLNMVATLDLKTSRCFGRAKGQYSIVYIASEPHWEESAAYPECVNDFLRLNGWNARLYSWRDAPHGAGRRFPAQFVSYYTGEAFREFHGLQAEYARKRAEDNRFRAEYQASIKAYKQEPLSGIMQGMDTEWGWGKRKGKSAPVRKKKACEDSSDEDFFFLFAAGVDEWDYFAMQN